MLKETGVPALHDDQKLNAGKGERGELGKNRRQVSWTESVRLTRIIERLALPEVAWSALGFAPCADRPHRRCLPHRSGSPETKGLSTTGQVSPFGATTQGFTACHLAQRRRDESKKNSSGSGARQPPMNKAIRMILPGGDPATCKESLQRKGGGAGLPQNTAMGLTGEPVTFLRRRGATVSRNSQRLRSAQARARSSRLPLSMSQRPMATRQTTWKELPSAG